MTPDLNISGGSLGNVQPEPLSRHEPGTSASVRPGIYETVVPGQGQALEGRNLAVGTGQQREQILEDAQRQHGFFSSLSNSFKSLGNALKGIFSRQSRELGAEQAFAATNSAMIQALETPKSPNSLSLNDAVMSRLTAHAAEMRSSLTSADLKKLVATGENIALALRDVNDADALSNLQQGRGLYWTGDNGSFRIQSSLYTTRALSWYMAANAALQDIDPARPSDAYSSLPSNGAFIMKDPDHKIYTFLSQAPTCTSRMSSHVAERSATTETHRILGILPSNKLAQKGIEDYRNCLPGQKGSLLFDKLNNQELYVKFESGGCPAFFGATEPHEKSVGLGRFFHALSRNLGHMVSFINTRSSGGEVEGRRQEHVYKGRLKETVYEPFKALANNVRALGGEHHDMLGSSKQVDKLAKKWGLPFVERTVTDLRDWANDDLATRQHIATQADALLTRIESEKQRLGGIEHGIERRGAEVHLDIYAHTAIRDQLYTVDLG